MENSRLQQVLDSSRLPSLPAAAIRIIELVQQPDVTVTELADAIAVDPALTSKVLKTANSPLYAQSRSISRLRDAVMLLGLRTMKTLALGFSLIDQLKMQGQAGFDHKRFWEQSLYAATAARTIAKRSGLPDPEEAFLGGLLQGLGVLACQQALGTEYVAVYNAASGDTTRLAELERAAFGFDHVTAATALAGRWNFPESLAACLIHASEPEKAPAATRQVVQSVAAGCRVAEVFIGEGDPEAVEMYRLACQSWFRMDTEQADAMLQDIDADARVMRTVLELPGGSVLTAGEILSRANEALALLTLQAEADNARLERERDQFSIQASSDPLTGVANRREFERVLDQQLRLARRYGFRVSIAMLDLDHFKRLNDTFGHQAGDEVLRQAAAVVRQNVRASDTVARYGGEEFVIVMPNTSLGGAASLANRVRAALDAHIVEFEGRDIFVTMSVGVAVYDPRSGASATELVGAADAALYEAKHAGRNAVRLGRVQATAA